jgi:hypothetical protein
MQLKDIAPSYGVASIVAITVYFLKYLPISNWVILPLQLILGTFVFFMICRIKKMEEYREVENIIQPIVKKFKRK